MAAIERYKSCRKCGHVNEHRLEWHGFMGGDGYLIVTCTVCGYFNAQKPADADTPKPRATEADLVVALKTWARTDSMTFDRWLQKQVRIYGGHFW